MAVRPKKSSIRRRGIGGARDRAFAFRGRDDLRGQRHTRGKKSGVSWVVRRDWAPELDPALITDHVRDVILAHHREAIRAGVRANTLTPQPDLAPGTIYTTQNRDKMTARASAREARTGGLKRGYDTGKFLNSIAFFPIKVRGPKVKARGLLSGMKMAKGRNILGSVARSRLAIKDKGRSIWLEKEDKRNTHYFFLDGKVQQLIDEAVSQVVDVAFIDGQSRPARMHEIGVDDTIH